MSAPANKPTPDLATLLTYGSLYLLLVSVLLRFQPALALILLVGGLCALAIFYGNKLVSGVRKGLSPKDENDFGERVRIRQADCQRKEERFRTEAEQIRHSISTLRDDIGRSADADAGEVERAEQLIKEFEAEFNLRHAKASFFADCGAKLKALLDRYQLQQSINARKKELDVLRSSNFDDEAALEETRYHLERDAIELDTIAELSKEAFVSFKAEQAEELRVRLEKLRSQL